MRKHFWTYLGVAAVACYGPINSSTSFLEYLGGNGTFMSSNSSLCSYKVQSIFLDKNIIELEDGSEWKVPQYDAYKLKFWRNGDLLEISPCESFFSSYTFWVTNTSSNTYVKANLHKAPPSFQETQGLGIKEISSTHLVLNNGFYWEVCSEDLKLLSQWEKKDSVLIGTNSTWLTSYDNILINCAHKNFVRVKAVTSQEEESTEQEKEEEYPSPQR